MRRKTILHFYPVKVNAHFRRVRRMQNDYLPQKPSFTVHASVQEKRPFNACTPKACIPKNHFYRQRMLPIKVSSCTLTSLAIVLTALW